MPVEWLPLIWAGLIAFAVIAYVVLDGFDLGLGILFPLTRSQEERNVVMNSVAPVWDGNETWLVLGGGGLLAAFPLAYAVILPALYMPLVVMLLALVFRGVAFEYRERTERWRAVWSVAFAGGSMVATVTQGIALGTLVQGIEMEGRGYAGGWFDWLTPFTVLTGFALLAGYALLGATWLVMKTEGEIQVRMRRLVLPLGLATFALIGAVSVATLFQGEVYVERWFTWPRVVMSVAAPALLALTALGLWRGVRRERTYLPFISAQGIFLVCFAGLAVSFWPDIIPGVLTIERAAAPDDSLLFTLVGAAITLPLILGYTAHAYWVFRGKVDPEEGYH
jgi:cytochrome d ubiquinol oxidase subunit II